MGSSKIQILVDGEPLESLPGATLKISPYGQFGEADGCPLDIRVSRTAFGTEVWRGRKRLFSGKQIHLVEARGIIGGSSMAPSGCERLMRIALPPKSQLARFNDEPSFLAADSDAAPDAWTRLDVYVSKYGDL